MKMAEPARKSVYEQNVARREQDAQRRRELAARQERQRLLRTLLLGLLGLLLLIGAVWLYTQRSGTVSGRVIDASRNEPLKGVRVLLDQQSQTPSDLTAAFIFSNVKPGEHQLSVQAEGFTSQSQKIHLDAGQAFRLDFKLLPDVSSVALKGKLLAVGTQNPSTISFLSPEFKEQKTVRIDGQPVDALILGNTAYLADLSQNQILIADLTLGTIEKKLSLPPNSAPAKLIYSPNLERILVMNTVGKSLMRLNPASRELQTSADASVALPFSPRDMIRRGDGSLMVLGPEMLGVLAPGEQAFGKVFALPGIYADRMRYEVSSDLLLIPGNGSVLRVNPQTGDTTTIQTGLPAGLVEIIDSARFAIANDQDLTIFSLQGDKLASRHFDGKIVLLSKAGEQLLIAIEAPNTLQLLDPQKLETRRELPISGKPVFGFSQSFD